MQLDQLCWIAKLWLSNSGLVYGCRNKPAVLCSAWCARNLTFTLCAWGRPITVGSSPNRSSLRDYRLLRRYVLPLVQEFLYSPKHSWFCVFFKVNVSLWLIYWKYQFWFRTAGSCRQQHSCSSSFFHFTILIFCGYLNIFVHLTSPNFTFM